MAPRFETTFSQIEDTITTLNESTNFYDTDNAYSSEMQQSRDYILSLANRYFELTRGESNDGALSTLDSILEAERILDYFRYLRAIYPEIDHQSSFDILEYEDEEDKEDPDSPVSFEALMSYLPTDDEQGE